MSCTCVTHEGDLPSRREAGLSSSCASARHLCRINQILLISSNNYSVGPTETGGGGNEVEKGVDQVNLPHAACPLCSPMG